MAVARLRLDSFKSIQLIKRASSPAKANTRIAAAKITSARVNPVRDRTPEASDGCLRQPISNGAGPLLFNTLRELSHLFIVFFPPARIILLMLYSDKNFQTKGESLRLPPLAHCTK